MAVSSEDAMSFKLTILQMQFQLSQLRVRCSAMRRRVPGNLLAFESVASALLQLEMQLNAALAEEMGERE